MASWLDDSIYGVAKKGKEGFVMQEVEQKLAGGRDDDDTGDALNAIHEHHGLTIKEEQELEASKHASHSEYYSSASVGPSRRLHARSALQNQCSPHEFELITDQINSEIFQDGRRAIEDREGLKKLIKLLSVHQEVQDGEVDWIFAMVDKHHSHHIEQSQMLDVNRAIDKWLAAKDKVEDMMEKYGGVSKYDKCNMGCLDREEVRHFLIDLNDGLHVDNKQLDEVIQNAAKYSAVHRAGSLYITELKPAITFWYNHVKPSVQSDVDGAYSKDRSKGGAVGRAQTSLHRIHTAPPPAPRPPNPVLNQGTIVASCAFDENLGATSSVYQKLGPISSASHSHHGHSAFDEPPDANLDSRPQETPHHDRHGSHQPAARVGRQGSYHHTHTAEVAQHAGWYAGSDFQEGNSEIEKQQTHHHHHHYDDDKELQVKWS